jgi:hypothetical protein
MRDCEKVGGAKFCIKVEEKEAFLDGSFQQRDCLLV